jgi:ADP-heptose:LPS heptosyltransferase
MTVQTGQLLTPADRVIAASLGTMAHLLFAGRRTPPLSEVRHEQARSYLIIRPEGLGDIILTLPAIAYLRRVNSNAKIAMAVRPMFADFVRDIHVVDEVISLDYPKKSTLDLKKLGRFLRQVWQLRRRFDIAYDFRGDPRNAMLGAWSAKMVIGELTVGTNFLLSFALARRADCSRAEQHLHLASLGRITPAPDSGTLAQCRFSATPVLLEAAGRLCAGMGNFVILHPGASLLSNRWTVENWRALARRIGQEGFTLVFTGAGAEEKQLVEEILSRGFEASARIINMAGKTTCSELAGMVGAACAVISPDTGIAHVAHGLGTPSVTMFGPNSEILNGYDSPAHRALGVTLPCRPCMAAVCPRSDFPRECIERISVDEVFSAFAVAVGTKSAGSERARFVTIEAGPGVARTGGDGAFGLR